MTDTERSLLASICGTGLPPAEAVAARADDTRRLAYADWLDENGRGERAEFVRVQVALATMPEPCEITPGGIFPRSWEQERISFCQECRKLKALCPYHVLERRERELLRSFRQQWEPDCYKLIPKGKSCNLRKPAWIDYKFFRGFVSALTCSWSDWLTHHAAILARHPVERVKLTTRPSVEEDEAANREPWTEIVAGGVFRVCGKLVEPKTPGNGAKGLLEARWPGIAFDLPPELAPPIMHFPPRSTLTLPDGTTVHAFPHEDRH